MPSLPTTGQTPWRSSSSSSSGGDRTRVPEPLAHTKRLINLQHVVSRVNEKKSVGRQKRGGGVVQRDGQTKEEA